MKMRPEHEEELEVLQSIYDGDTNFTVVNNNTFQYKYEDECGNKSFLIELQWGEEYPDAAPIINMDLFFNKHLIPEVKDKIISGLEEQAENNLGMSMTFTLFEWLKEVKDDILETQPTEPVSSSSTSEISISNDLEILAINDDNTKKKKEQLTKAQKRKMWDKQNADGERARGWDWVDIVKHLSQSGNSTS